MDYDPRVRPWYVSAITGNKNIIILFDISRSMTSMFPGSRFRNARTTLEIIVRTLNENDYIGIILFSRTAKTFEGFPKMIRANR